MRMVLFLKETIVSAERSTTINMESAPDEFPVNGGTEFG
jgi:hypothetical protein